MIPHLQNHITHASGRRKTVCTSSVLAFFNIAPSEYHYSHSMDTVANVLRRKGYSVRSRNSALRVGSSKSIGQIRRRIAALGEWGMYLVTVSGHILLLDSNGQTVVDTDPRKRDRRRVVRVCKVTK